ncbi:putative 2-ketoarginine decarboxylase AruI [Nocardioides dokdonensis FR1436]|uniref:Putative 2-ketoarginine decarboxylase AruI n=1 Tax=Nocardioides dokdonensis FR1436 TaxID=1300347 RepID=A0A1A9GJ06_9ACTN|nr:thiamine pyrophosphate-binding protein [Nocardioides dokdonensis]ANH38248.1 putative 2-ketoarginine decarboxylase AruI [Nocardioides dokdonensis FR1436]
MSTPTPAAQAPTQTGGEALVAALAAHGVDTVFGIPGTHNLPIYAHLDAYGVRHFSPRHEQGAGYAADGYARSSGRPGVALTTSGPAVLNAAAAVAQAYSDSVPVLLISPGLPLAHPGLGNGYLHEVKDQQQALASVVAYSHRVTSVAEIPLAVAQAFATMTSGRPRPVHLEIPLDLLDESDVVVPVAPVPVAVSMPPAEVLAAAAEVLGSAQRPGIVAGGGARHAAAELVALAERWGAPVVTTTNGKGAVADDHELALGAGVHHPAVAAFAADCDVVLVVGSELAPADLWIGPLPYGGQVVRIDVDPVQVVTNALPDLALVGDAATCLAALTARLPGTPAEDAVGRADHWRKQLQGDARAEGRIYLSLIEAMAQALDRDAIVAADSAMACYYGALSNLPSYTPSSFLYPTGLGTLGYGLPAAIGAKIAHPDRQVIAMHGDGGVMFTIAELAGAAEAGLAIPLLVVDNGGYGEIRNEQVARGDATLGVDLGRVDFPTLARGLGCHGVSVEVSGLAAELRKAFAADRPTLVHVMEPTDG